MTTNPIHKPSLKLLVPCALIAASGIALAEVDDFDFSNEDLLLSVQATGGTGSNKNLFLKLGNTVTIKNTPNQGIITNIGAVLVANYDTNWFTRADLRFGVIGNRSNLSPASDPGVPPQEPGRTLYVSRETTSAGTAALRPQLSTTSLSTICTPYSGMRAVLTQADENTIDDFFTALPPSGATILDQVTQPVSWTNGWTAWNPAGGNSFVGLSNIEAAFGTGSEVLVDVQRMVPSAPTTYITTVGIDSSGNVRVFTAPPASPYTTWINSFNPPLTNAADRLASADPDNDDIENVLEFVLNGNPSVSSQSILPTLDASGSNFVFSFNRRDDSESPETSQIFQHSPDLVVWTDVPIGATSSGSVTVVENGSAVDNITVTIPKGSNTKLFGRLKVVK